MALSSDYLRNASDALQLDLLPPKSHYNCNGKAYKGCIQLQNLPANLLIYIPILQP